MKKKEATIPASEEQKKQWQDKYGKGNIAELHSDGKYCYVHHPSISIEKWKMACAARRKSLSSLVDAVINNCWIGGDESLKNDEAFRFGIEDQVDNLLDLPDYEIEKLENGNVLIKVGSVHCEARTVTRMDLAYAKDRNKDNKPFDTQIYLLERIAVTNLDEIRKNIKVYISMMLATDDIREAKHVEIKNF